MAGGEFVGHSLSVISKREDPGSKNEPGAPACAEVSWKRMVCNGSKIPPRGIRVSMGNTGVAGKWPVCVRIIGLTEAVADEEWRVASKRGSRHAQARVLRLGLRRY